MISIAVTGGPSSGKTTIINELVIELRQLGYNVIVSPEMATITINSGILPAGDNAINDVTFQQIILMRQLVFESTCLMAAKELGDNTVLLFDRGSLDGYAYVDKDKWEYVLESQNQKTLNLLANYDAVIYLEGKENFFTTKNNKAHYEKSADEAIIIWEKVLQTNLSHDKLVIVKD
ncbi:MAG: ATP-binding protein, partial [Bacilli bacterium]|nr:ATP-binding protein [Bacilli bacterium]